MSRKARDGRWDTKFGKFVAEFGVPYLAARLGFTPAAIHQWVRGKTAPDHRTARQILRIARGRDLTINDIYRRTLSE